MDRRAVSSAILVCPATQTVCNLAKGAATLNAGGSRVYLKGALLSVVTYNLGGLVLCCDDSGLLDLFNYCKIESFALTSEEMTATRRKATSIE